MLQEDERKPLVFVGNYPSKKENGTTVDGDVNDTMRNNNFEGNGQEKQTYTKEQKILFICIALSNLFHYISWSILPPFFPTEAAKQGASPTQVGLIFGIYSLIKFFTSPIFGKFLPIIGARFMYISGYFVIAGCNIIFGFLVLLQPGTQFVLFCAVTRSLEALGTAAVMTAGMSLLANTFPNSIGQVTGIIEIFVGIGMMVGPFIGGVLYDVGGYVLPFTTLGGVLLVDSAVLLFILPKDDENILRKCGSYLRLMSIPGTWVGTSSAFIGAASLTFLDPTLSPELEKFNLTPIEVGLVFLLIGVSYGIAAPIFGWLADKYDIPRILIIFGLSLAGVGYLVIGSWVPLHIHHTIVSMSIGIVIINIAIGSSLTPTFQDYLSTLVFNGMPDNMSTYGVVSGMFNSAYSLGNINGYLVGCECLMLNLVGLC